MKKLFKFLIGLFLLIIAVGIWLLGFGGYMPWTYQVSRGEPEMVGKRQNAQGQVVQRIFRKMNNSSVAVLFTPEGPGHDTKYKMEFFLQQEEKPMVLLPFLSDKKFRYVERIAGNIQGELGFCDKFLAVTNSPLWAAAGTDPLDNQTGGNDFHIVVFDENHVLSHTTFNM
ncbi:MAG TPA: hypothetical protein VH251_06360, partial [Verrucomicrobiae bacterium]|nr:hypothetical protein [Verrucomicrobiae bacterium]